MPAKYLTECQHPGCTLPRTPGSPALCAAHKSARKKNAYHKRMARKPKPVQMTPKPRKAEPDSWERPSPVGVHPGRYRRVAMGVSGWNL
jgi:hypothetical protein